jgi:hypothetical protein
MVLIIRSGRGSQLPNASSGVVWLWLVPLLQPAMKPREYCCCAVPLINAGIYATLTEQCVVGIVVGTLSVATPSSKHPSPPRVLRSLTPTVQVVGAVTPSFAPALLAAFCYAAAALQILGFLGVARVSGRLPVESHCIS